MAGHRGPKDSSSMPVSQINTIALNVSRNFEAEYGPGVTGRWVGFENLDLVYTHVFVIFFWFSGHEDWSESGFHIPCISP